MNLLIRILCENKVANKHKQGQEIKLLWTSCYHLFNEDLIICWDLFLIYSAAKLKIYQQN